MPLFRLVTGKLPVTCVAKLTLLRVPPKVIVPELVIGPPVRVMPLTVPAVATEVTVPPGLLELMVWLGQLPVMVTLVPAISAGVAVPEPPLATATMPVTLDAVPVVFWFSVGTSAATMARKVGVPAEPLGAAKKKLAVWLAKVPVKVPEVVTGEPETVKILGRDNPTEVTLPVP